MKTFLAICLLTAAFAFVPSAEAGSVCDPTGAVCASSDSSGDCSNGGVSNSATTYVPTEAGYYYGGAYTGCGSFGGFFSYSQIGASGALCTDAAGCVFYGAAWQSFTIFGTTTCETYVYVDAGDFEYVDIGCPAGPPPGVPALIP